MNKILEWSNVEKLTALGNDIKHESDGTLKFAKIVDWDSPLDLSGLWDKVKYDIERKPYTMSIEVRRTDGILKRLLGHREVAQYLLERIAQMAKGKQRKITYKTIRRNCAKRNK